MNKIKMFLVVSALAVSICAVFSVGVRAQFQPCVWPNKCAAIR